MSFKPPVQCKECLPGENVEFALCHKQALRLLWRELVLPWVDVLHKRIIDVERNA